MKTFIQLKMAKIWQDVEAIYKCMRLKLIGFIDDKYINLLILYLKRNQLTESYFMYDSLLIWLY